MSPIDDDTLDRLLGRHLSARLDGQLGKAEAAFRRRLAQGDTAAPNGAADVQAGVPHLRLVPAPDAAAAAAGAPARRRTFGGWTLGWLAGVAGTAAAAGLAAVFLIGGPTGPGTTGGGDGRRQLVGSNTQPSDTGRPSDRGAGVRPPAVRYVHNRTVDEGTVPDDFGRPVRRYRHQQVEHLRWVDERGATVEMTIPREGVEQYELDTY
ncbi:MAG TPA: hypothetical protein VF796_14805 [Humisphaera sp.]